MVVLVDRERAVADLTIHWCGGASTKLTNPLNHTGGHRYVTSAEVNELVRKVAAYYTDEQVAFMLNAKHLRTGRGNSFTTARVGMCAADLASWRPIRRAYPTAMTHPG